MSITSGERLRTTGAITINSPKQVISGSLDESKSADIYQLRFTKRSSLQLALKGGAGLEVIHDRNRNGRLDRKEIVARIPGDRSSTSTKLDSLTLHAADKGPFFVRIFSSGERQANYQLMLSAAGSPKSSGAWAATGNGTASSRSKPAASADSTYRLRQGESGYFYLQGSSSRSISTSHWNARFINRTASNVDDYDSYDFDSPDGTKDLGFQNSSGRRIARLKVDLGKRKPSGIQDDNFAMQVWTRVRLQAGKLYQLSSQSDDGVRFLFVDPQTRRVVKTLDGDWRDRKTDNPSWKAAITPATTGEYDLYVQYYERWGKSRISVNLTEKSSTGLTGRVSVSPGLYLRRQPSTAYNQPIGVVESGETFKILRQVQPNTASSYGNWYEITTRDGKRGYISADPRYIEVRAGGNDVVVVNKGSDSGNGGTWQPPYSGGNGNNGGNGNGGNRPPYSGGNGNNGGNGNGGNRPPYGGGGSSGSPKDISQKGVNLVKSFEGLSLTAYRDAVGVWTIGYGTTDGVRQGMRITQDEAEDLLKQDLDKFERAVLNNVKVRLNRNQFDALVSFTYNVGEGALASSTLLRLLNQGDYRGAADQFLRWNKGNGQELAGLTRRRKAERALFLGEDYTAYL